MSHYKDYYSNVSGDNRRIIMKGFGADCTEVAREAVCVLNSNGTVAWSNELFAVYFGADQNPMVGKNIFSILQSYSFGESLSEQLTRCSMKGEQVVSMHHSNETHIAEFSATCTPVDSTGSMVLSIAELEQKPLQYNWNKVIDATQAMLIIIDKEHNLLDANKSVLQFTKKTKNEIIGKKCYEVMHQLFNPVYGCPLKHSLTTKSPAHAEQYDPASGKHFLAETSPVFDSSGEIVSILGAMYDITPLKETERVLVEGGENFQNIFQYSVSAMFIINQQYRIADVNQAACRLLEFSDDELIGKHILDITHPDDHGITNERLFGIKKPGQKIFRMEKRYVTKSGHIVYGQVSASKVKRESKKDFYIAQVADISSAIREKELLMAKAEQFKTLFTDSESMKLLIDPQTKKIIEANKAACKFYGYTHKEITQLTIDKINTLPEKQLERQMNRAMNNERSFFKIKHRLKNGETKNVEVHSGEIEYENKRLLYSIIHDATPIEKAQQALVESEARYRKMIDNMHSGVAVYKPYTDLSDFEFVDFNKAAERITKSSRKQIIGSTLMQQFPNMEKSELFKALVTCAKTGEDIFLPPLFYKDKQREGWRKNHIYKLNTGEIVAIFEDVTPEVIARKKLIEAKNKAEEADKLKSSFLANVSHEIRSPMNGIIGFAQRLSHPGLLEHKRSLYTRIIIESSSQLLSILNDVLDISKIETGQVAVSRHVTKLNAMLDDLYTFYKTSTTQKGLNLFVKKALSDSEATIETDETKLRQILNNLINNALKFTPQGYIEFGYKHVNNNIVFYVKDTGIGIEESKQKKIFDRFSQVGANKYENNGTGLGLAICKSYVELMGGRITIQSTSGSGTTFKFDHPYQLTPKAPAHNTIVNEQVLQKNMKQTDAPTILIAEDEDLIFASIREELHDLNIELLHAKNEAEAIEMVKEYTQIGLVLMDIKMSAMNGLEATQKIKDLRPELPIISQSAHSMATEIIEALAAVCNKFLTKPIENKKLMGTLSAYLIKI
jgi:PAS domain S-box-containing protein